MATMVLPDREAWLAERRNGLGASDVSAALGINAWKSPYVLWAEKCGLLPEEDLAAESEAVEWGLRLEGPIIKAFAEKTGRLVEVPESPTLAVHPSIPFLRCTVDALQRKAAEEPLGDLQIKTTSAYKADEWKDGAVPLMYQVQVQAELFVTGLAWGSIACLIGGQRLVYRDIERDDAFIEALVPHLEQFWSCVQSQTPPDIDASQATSRILQQLHPDDDGSTISLPPDADAWHTELLAVNEKIKALEELKNHNQNRLKAALGAATYGTLANGSRYSFKTQTRAEHVVAASKFRVLRFSKG